MKYQCNHCLAILETIGQIRHCEQCNACGNATEISNTASDEDELNDDNLEGNAGNPFVLYDGDNEGRRK